MKEICQRCYEDDSDGDLRTLYMKCGYEMNELDLPFNMDENNYYTLTVCKTCRSDWMKYIRDWFNTKPEAIDLGTGILIREFGAIREVTEEEYEARYPGAVPYLMTQTKILRKL